MHIPSGFIILILAVGVLLYFLYPMYHATRVSKVLIENAIPYEQHPAVAKYHILVAGDSTAVGVGTEHSTESTAGRIGAQFPDADITNVAVSGSRLKDIVPVLESQSGKHFDLILLQIGANDVTHLTAKNMEQAEVQQVLSVCDRLATQTIVLTAGDMGLSSVFHWPLSLLMTRGSLQLRTIFMNTAAQFPSVSYVDLFVSKRDDPFSKDPDAYYAPDHFHLTDAGYGIWYEKIAPLIRFR